MKKPYRFWKRNEMYYVMFANTPGKWVSTGCKTKDDAIRWAEASRRNEFTEYHNVPTLEKFAKGFFVPGNEVWINRLKKKKKSFASGYFKAHQGRMDNYILPEYGSRLITSLNKIEIDNWFIDLKSVKSGSDLSDNAKNKILHAFRIILEEAKYQGYVKDNVAAAVEEIHE